MPDIAAAAAETNDAEPVAVAALRFRPGDRGIEIGEQFGVGLALTLGIRSCVLPILAISPSRK